MDFYLLSQVVLLALPDTNWIEIIAAITTAVVTILGALASFWAAVRAGDAAIKADTAAAHAEEAKTTAASTNTATTKAIGDLSQQVEENTEITTRIDQQTKK